MESELLKSLKTGFMDKNLGSFSYYQPKLIVNDKKEKKKILSTLLYELRHCESFVFSVAFLSKSGVAVLINTLEELQQKGVRGEVLVSQYLNFTEPEALKSLLQFDNIDLRIVTNGDFHAKGYFFKYPTHYSMIVGSSNLTAPALTTNKEWNLYVVGMEHSKLIEDSLEIFYQEYHQSTKVDDRYIKAYEKIYIHQGPLQIAPKEQVAEHRLPAAEDQLDYTADSGYQTNNGYTTDFISTLKPNPMQYEAMENLTKIRRGFDGKPKQDKAMIISATGTGKTYLSVFDAQNFNPERLLFVVHRGNIARAAMNSYKEVFGSLKSMGLFSGGHKDTDKDFVFSTVQTLSKEYNLKIFDPSTFDYIVIDESHHAGAATYQKILSYFKPKFLLGMTATPERTDGYNVFKDFDHNIAFEVRLHRALDENMLCPFHYYGVTDVSVDVEGDSKEVSFDKLTSGERVKQIIDKSKFYGTDNGKIHGLVFCNLTNVAEELSRKFNKRGFNTIALTGKDSEEGREAAIERLEMEEETDKLDYIFTVDIFNEGIDIPKVNQIIMLRPTQSAIVFVQQLGRGLRKTQGKEYLTVIDFIGNYQNNYLIPVALYGDGSYSKDRLRKLVATGSTEIPGASSINFDRIAKEEIFKAIDTANMQLKKDLDRDYDLLKFKLGKVPMMMDFVAHGSRDPMLYVRYSNSYYNYLSLREETYQDQLDEKAKKVLEFFSLHVANGKRYEELFVLEALLGINVEKSSQAYVDVQGNQEVRIDEISTNEISKKELMESSLACDYLNNLTEKKLTSAVININLQFMKERFEGKLIPINEKYNIQILDQKRYEVEGVLAFSNEFINHLQHPVFKECFLDQLSYGIYSFQKDYNPSKDIDGFVLYRKYARKDVFRILGWDENPLAQNVGGYMISKDHKDCAIFVNYHKEEDISSTTKYEDRFITPDLFQWMSKSRRKLDSKDVRTIGNYKEHEMRLPLFVKKHNDEGFEFYYMGDTEPLVEQFEEQKMDTDNGKSVSVVKMMLKLKSPVPHEMYEYITSKEG